MLKKSALILTVFIYIMFSSITIPPVQAQDHNKEIVYLYDPLCTGCLALENYGLFDMLEDNGVDVRSYDVTRRKNIPYAVSYIDTYNVPGGMATPLIFAGDMYYRGEDDIIDAFESGELEQKASEPLLDTSETPPREYSFIAGLLLMIVGGLLDGINPCAIAMLLLFISMIGFTKNVNILLTIGISYILAIFITYFFLGLGILHLGFLLGVSKILYFGFAALFTILFLITFYDFIVTRKENYGKVKNQLPKIVQLFNKKVMQRFSAVIENEDGGIKRYLLIVGIPFLIGIIVGVTEAACTGQIYLGVLSAIISSNPGEAITILEIFYILIFNLMFIVPLIIILVIAIKSKSVMGISNFIREHLSTIKLITSLFFLLMVVYFVLLIFDFNLFNDLDKLFRK